MIWKQSHGWVQYNPSPNHSYIDEAIKYYDEWQKLKQQKEKEDGYATSDLDQPELDL